MMQSVAAGTIDRKSYWWLTRREPQTTFSFHLTGTNVSNSIPDMFVGKKHGQNISYFMPSILVRLL
jgi:hypothetical protein